MTHEQLVAAAERLALVPCGECGGNGYVEAYDPFSHPRRKVASQQCSVCGGTGQVRPPLCITAAEIAWAMEVLNDILGEVSGRLAAA